MNILYLLIYHCIALFTWFTILLKPWDTLVVTWLTYSFIASVFFV